MESYSDALKILDNLLRSYDGRVPPQPDAGNGNVTVSTKVHIRDFLSIDEKNNVRRKIIFLLKEQVKSLNSRYISKPLL